MVPSPSSVRSNWPRSWSRLSRSVSQAVAPMAQAATANDRPAAGPESYARIVAAVAHLVTDAVDREEITGGRPPLTSILRRRFITCTSTVRSSA